MGGYGYYAVSRLGEGAVDSGPVTLWYCHRGTGRAWMPRGAGSRPVRLNYEQALDLSYRHGGRMHRYQDALASFERAGSARKAGARGRA